MTPSRRSVLAAAGAALVTGCTRSRARPAPPPPPVDPDVALRAQAVAREQSLISELDLSLAVVAGTPAAALLRQVRADHVVHLQALVPALPGDPGRTPPAPTPSIGSRPSAHAPAATARTQAAHRRAQAARERSAAAAHASATGNASGQLAALLAQLAASEASHAAVAAA